MAKELVHAAIHNFGGIQNASVSPFDYNLLLASNNPEKSNVINTVRAFSEKDGTKHTAKILI